MAGWKEREEEKGEKEAVSNGEEDEGRDEATMGGREPKVTTMTMEESDGGYN